MMIKRIKCGFFNVHGDNVMQPINVNIMVRIMLTVIQNNRRHFSTIIRLRAIEHKRDEIDFFGMGL